MTPFGKNNELESELLIIDGLWGNGKLLVCNLLAAIEGMEAWRHVNSFDHLPVIYGMNAIEESAAITLIKNIFDELTYNTCISREVNFRYGDLTSVLRHSKKWQYISRFFGEEGDAALSKTTNMMIPVATHMSSVTNDLFLKALNNRCKIIECVRHPIFMLDHWVQYIGRCDNDPRDFTLKLDYKNKNIPWFAAEWGDEYLEINNTERSIKSISILTEKLSNNITTINTKYGEDSVFIVPFESLASNTDEVLQNIAKYLGRDYNSKLLQKLKIKNNVPRENVGASLGYTPGVRTARNWDKKIISKMQIESLEKEQRLKKIQSIVQPKYYDELLSLIDKYEKNYYKL